MEKHFSLSRLGEDCSNQDNRPKPLYEHTLLLFFFLRCISQLSLAIEVHSWFGWIGSLFFFCSSVVPYLLVFLQLGGALPVGFSPARWCPTCWVFSSSVVTSMMYSCLESGRVNASPSTTQCRQNSSCSSSDVTPSSRHSSTRTS